MASAALRDAIYHGRAAKDAGNAIRILYDDETHIVDIYAYDAKELSLLYHEILKEVRRRNSEIDNIEDQMLISFSSFEAVYECRHVYVYELEIGRAGERAAMLHPFSVMEYNVLSDPDWRKPLDQKCLKAIALLGSSLFYEKGRG